MSAVVVTTLVAAGVGGTFAGFVDTEESPNNFVQAGILDLLINGKNDPNIPPKISIQWIQPCKSYDFFIEVEYWGKSTHNGDLWMHYKNVESTESGNKTGLVWDGNKYIPGSPVGAGVATTEPELIAEEGDGYFGQIYIRDDDANLLDVDYASGVADHLSILTWVYDPDHNGILDMLADEAAAQAAAATPADWDPVPSLCGKLVDIECNKDFMGKVVPQEPTFIWVRVHLQQILAYETDPATGEFVLVPPITGVKQPWPEPQREWWPTNALQGDTARWDMLFELIGDP